MMTKQYEVGDRVLAYGRPATVLKVLPSILGFYLVEEDDTKKQKCILGYALERA